MKRLFPLILAATLAAPVWADSSVSAKVWNLSYTLEDLNPFDGVKPGITFKDSPEFASNAALMYLFYGTPGGGPAVDSQRPIGAGVFSPISASSTDDFRDIQVSVSGDGTLGGTVLSASANVPTIDGAFSSFIAHTDVMDKGFGTFFTLTPNTRVRFSADYELVAKLFYDGLLPSHGGDLVSADAALLMFDGGSGAQTDSDQVNVNDVHYNWSQGAGRTSQGQLFGSLTNRSNQSIEGGVRFGVAINGDIVTAIPEPSTMATTLLGLTLMGAFFARGRRRDVASGL